MTYTDNRGPDNEVEPVTVTASSRSYTSGGGSAGGGSSSGTQVLSQTKEDPIAEPGGQAPPTTISEQEPGCVTDRAAMEAQSEIVQEPDDASREHGTIIYRGDDGLTYRSPLINGGERATISTTDLQAWMSANGVRWSQVTGFVHNHPDRIYGSSSSDEKINRYPSGGSDVYGLNIEPGKGDWPAAEAMVRAGAGGPGGAGFSLYIVDTKGVLRQFRYTQRDYFYNLRADDRVDGEGLPPAMDQPKPVCD